MQKKPQPNDFHLLLSPQLQTRDHQSNFTCQNSVANGSYTIWEQPTPPASPLETRCEVNFTEKICLGTTWILLLTKYIHINLWKCFA